MKAKIYLNLHYFSVFLFSIFPLLPNKVKGIPVMFFFLTTLYIFVKERKYNYPFKKVFFFSSLFLVLLISLLYTSNFIRIDQPLSTRLSLIIVPISFGFLNATDRKLDFKFLENFIKLIIFFHFVFCIWIIFYLYQLGFYSSKMNLYVAISYLTNEMWYIKQHPIYSSIFISISILLTFFYVLKINKKNTYLIVIPLLITMLYVLLVLERKSVFLSLLISLILTFCFFSKISINSKLIKLIILVIGVLTFFFTTTGRFKELYNNKTYSVVNSNNSTSLRYAIYTCALKKIKEAPLFGFGIGDTQNELEKCYNKSSKALINKTYNSHNQYLSYFLSCGIIGFFLLLYIVIKTIFNAIKKKNMILFSITIFFSISMLFENILERQSGVILFSFYICLFSFHNFSGTQTINVKNK